MSLGIIGEERDHTITLFNGYCICIEFEGGMYFESTRYHADSRQIRLYNEKKELLSELVEDNPHKGEDKTRVKEHLKKLGYPKPNAYKHDPNKINLLL